MTKCTKCGANILKAHTEDGLEIWLDSYPTRGYKTVDTSRLVEQDCLYVQHSTVCGQPRQSILAFARLMEEKLKANDNKKHWSTLDPSTIFSKANLEITEVTLALRKIRWFRSSQRQRDLRRKLAYECADVANYFMMLAEAALKNVF